MRRLDGRGRRAAAARPSRGPLAHPSTATGSGRARQVPEFGQRGWNFLEFPSLRVLGPCTTTAGPGARGTAVGGDRRTNSGEGAGGQRHEELAAKLRLTAAALGCTTHKDLCGRFSALNPATEFDLERS